MKMQTTVSGQGNPIVLVGGGITGSLSWQPHAQRLSKERKVILCQLISVQYGLENRPLPPDYSLKTESLALTTALDELESELGESFDLVAWSFGAEIALDYALDHPDRVRSLTLIEPPALWVLKAKQGLDRDAENFLSKVKNFDGEISDHDLENLLRSIGLVPADKSAKDLPQWPNWSKHRNSLRNRRAAWEHTDDISRLSVLKNCPLLLVKGSGSNKIFHTIIDALANELPQTEIVEMAYGHSPHLISMNTFLDKLTQFQKNIVDHSHLMTENIPIRVSTRVLDFWD
jgi:pimeloyl-ACP methyl ester carboxylesterase